MKKRHFRNKVRRNHRKNGNHQTRQIVKREPEFPSLPEKIEQALIGGDLTPLSPEERVQLYMQTCRTLKLNPLTKPFGYILFKQREDDDDSTGKLVLYATRNCTDQLRSFYGASDVPNSLKRSEDDDYLYAEIQVVGRNGRVSADLGVIPKTQYSRKTSSFYKMTGRELANAKMKVVTKARRRATLALYGLGGVVDESELDTMNVIGGVTKEGRIWRYANHQEPQRALIEYGDYPKGGPKAALAEAQLDKVEKLDREFASKVAAPSLPAQGTASKSAQSTPAGAGSIGDNLRRPAQAARVPGGSPKSPGISKEGKEVLSSEAGKLPGKGKPGQGSLPLGGPKQTPQQPASEVPQARIPRKITKVSWTTDSKGLRLELDGKGGFYCWRDHLMGGNEKMFDLILNGLGREAIFLTEPAKFRDGTAYTNVKMLVQLGEREWDDDGVPMLRREPRTREPGEEAF